MTKKNILMISDDIRHTSGVSNQSRHLLHRLRESGNNIYQIGVVTKISDDSPVVYNLPNTDKSITIYPSTTYDDISLILRLIENHKIDCLVIMTDPYRFAKLFHNSTQIRSKCPIVYYAVWDSDLTPAPYGKPHFNRSLYQSVDGIGCISRQTEWFVNDILKDVNDKPLVSYIGHGSDSSIYKPLTYDETKDMRTQMFGNKEYKYVVLMANRNQSRKKFADLIYAYNEFASKLPEAESEQCAMILHTEQITPYGTDLVECVKALAPTRNIYFTTERYNEKTMNELYNIADVVVNCSNAEGYGLTTNESLLAGTPIIANSTGGLQDQIGYFDNGIPVWYSPKMKQNQCNLGRGVWAYPLFPQRTIIGSPTTPYLFDENASLESIENGLMYWYDKSNVYREAAGLRGRQWLLDNNQHQSAWTITMMNFMDTVMNNYKPQELCTVQSI